MGIVTIGLKSIEIAELAPDGGPGTEFKKVWDAKNGFNQRKKLNRKQSLKFIYDNAKAVQRSY